MHVKLCCMLCFEEKNDAPSGWDFDEYGDVWTYCRACDCWTSHPCSVFDEAEKQTTEALPGPAGASGRGEG